MCRVLRSIPRFPSFSQAQRCVGGTGCASRAVCSACVVQDGTVRVWHASTYRLENTLNYGMGRVWSVQCCPGSNKISIGYDEGGVMIKLGSEVCAPPTALAQR